jgi:hypothetical protein
MKNIHLIQTDKPSRLSILNSGKLNFGAEFISSSNSKAQHIYITSDEEIKEGDYIFETDTNKVNIADKDCYINEFDFKIILTTDQDLIKDGVQSINDEFLQWFVKNPSCEKVNLKEEDYSQKCRECGEYVKRGYSCNRGCFMKSGNFIPTDKNIKYKIIIPKEEPKQENCCTPVGQIKRYVDCVGCDRKPKQHVEFINNNIEEFDDKLEQFKQASEHYAHNHFNMHETNNYKALKQGFEAGAKWQAEQMFELMNQYTDDVMAGCNLRAEEWVSQFKKQNNEK